MRLRLLVTESAAYEDVDLTLLKRVFEVHLMSSGDTDLERRIRDVQPNILLVGLGMTVGHTEIGAAQHLQLVVSPTTGSDHLDTELLQTRGIDILTLRDRQFVLEKVSSTAELAWGLLLTVARQIGRATASVSKGEWQRQRFMGMQLQGKTLGIVGLGRLGGYVADYGIAFKMLVIATDPNPASSRMDIELCSLDELVRRADVISIHVPLTATTRQMFNQSILEHIKVGGILINTSRGEVVDEVALATLVRSGHIGGYGTDVLSGDVGWDKEVQPNPVTALIAEGFNVVATPHIGGYTHEAVRFTRRLVVDALINRFSLTEQ
jgi:D-3-phosphoglycerate dehydrogenase